MKRSVVTLFSLLLLGACAGSPDETTHCTGKCDSASAELVAFSCDTASDGQVECARALPADFPLSADITLATLDGSNVASLAGSAKFRAPAGTKILAMVSVGSTQAGLFHADGDTEALDAINRHVTLPAGKSSYTLPYDLWRIQLTGATMMANANLSTQSFHIAPWETFLHNLDQVERTHAPLPLYEGKGGEMFVIVERGRKTISGTATFCNHDDGCAEGRPFALFGSDEYNVSITGLSRAGADMGGPTVDSSPDLGTTPSTSPDLTPPDPEAPDLSPPTVTDATPTCGGDGQPQCYDNGSYFCDDHHVYKSGLCHACGKDLQPQCYQDGSYFCEGGFVYTNGLCRACGHDKQPQCYQDGSYFCELHFVYANGLCHACGREAEPQCYQDGSYFCDDGFVYSNGLCRTP